MSATSFLNTIEAASPTVLIATSSLVTVGLLLGLAVVYIVQNARAMGSRERIEALLSTTQQGFLLWNGQGRIVESNPALRDLTGLSEREVKARTIQHLFDPDLTQLEGRVQLEARLKRRDGGTIPCLVDSNTLASPKRRERVRFAFVTDISERVRAEEEIRHREAHVHALLDATPDPLIIADADGLITMANRQAEATFGYAAIELIGQPVDVLLPAAIRSAHAQRRTDYMKSPVARQMGQGGVLYAQTKQGTQIPVDVRLSPIRTSTGDWVVGAVRDISKQLATVNALRASVAEHTAIFESASIGIVQLKHRIIVRANARCHEMLGYAQGELIGQSTQVWYPQEQDYGRIGDEAYPAIWGGETSTGERLFRRKDGRTIWVRTSHRAIDASEPALGSVVMLQDVTAEREAAAAITLANQEQSAILDTATCGVALIRDRIFVRCNRRLHDMFGWDEGQMIGQPTAIWYPDQASNDRAKALYDTIWQGEHASLELELMRRDGSRFWARLTGNAVDVHTPSKGTVWIVDDITDEREMTVALQDAKEAAEAATRAKSDFLSNMSHEIRTPMNAIIGMSSLALKTSLTPQQRNYVEKVHRAGKSLLGIINDILDFSKIEAGKMTLERTGFRLDDVIDNVSNIIGMKAEEKDVEFVVQVSADVPDRLVGDPLRLGQVLINLGINAAKFTDQGEIVVGVEVASRRGQEVELHFQVRDTGIGMTPEQCASLFQSFSQADASTTRRYGGTGLGLSISKQLVELMNGSIWVDSVVGQGSTFHFRAWFAVDNGPLPQRMLTAGEMRGVRVLVVDDSEVARDILVDMTRSLGLEGDGAATGEAALQAMAAARQQGRPYQVLLTDWRMPAMDGVDLIERVGHTQGASLPTAIMVTAFRREDALAKARERGVDVQAVLTKPVTQSSLLQVIGAALGRQVGLAEPSDLLDDGARGFMDQVRGARVLLVEDNDMNLELALELLTSAGMEVVAATHGQQALDILADDPDFDGILMDCQMPVMDGYSATRAIRAMDHFQRMPILAMTANAMAGDRDKAIEAGMWDHIAKPYDVPAMFATIARWIRPAAHRQMAASEAAGPAEVVAALPMSVELPEALPGIDLQAGLATSMGNQVLYQRMLVQFCRKQAQFAQAFAQARASADATAATRCAHTLRGTAGNIGAKPLAQAAGELEQACKSAAPPDELDARLQQTLAALDRVIEGLNRWIGGLPSSVEPVARPAAAPVDPAQASEAANQLHALLKAGDVLAVQFWQDQAPQLRAALPQDWPSIGEHLQAFDFDAALSQLERALGRQ